ncbi:uncharacterized protein LOC131060375 [Cryptomeria japonica]|uniref:uncharacterized protein LOC131060375 n=1 Tax=Cryptomeria japonica TaxID=3369 RepID=UPI0027DA98DA|nr:uncharacterized protein LOC131060375 [Cryptomeria japonica]
MQRLRASAPSFLKSFKFPQLNRKASNTWSAVQDTYFSTKDVFERHRVVFTVGTSIASVATAWAGYSLRYLHQSKVEERLNSIEQAMTKTYQVEQEQIKKIVNAGHISYEALAATAATSLIVGYGLGWRGGKWRANKIFRKQQQQKLLGSNKPQKWRFLRKPFLQLRNSESKVESRVTSVNASNSGKAQLS